MTWICAATAALLTAASCTSGSLPGTTRDSAGTVTNDASALVVEVAADPSSVPLRGRLRITVTVTNKSRAPVSLEFSSGCQTDYELLDASGALLGASGEMCTQATGRRTLAPGESFSDSHTWIRGLPGMPQASGTRMLVRGVLLAVGKEIRSESTVRVELP